ncbi:hypothetical protein PR048_013495 [Dryococelus australis]|uniref:Uncharacterized protein n=1 Tax=Dryococelus australis TaxID=614101 RepID=A0ABQ9HSC0_9NEOP|nr:hypothetical protein PR048_013495 [Dryococelus australis]
MQNECKSGGNGRSPKKPADQRHRPTRFPHAKIRERPCRALKLGSPSLEASSLTAKPPRPHMQLEALIFFIGCFRKFRNNREQPVDTVTHINLFLTDGSVQQCVKMAAKQRVEMTIKQRLSSEVPTNTKYFLKCVLSFEAPSCVTCDEAKAAAIVSGTPAGRDKLTVQQADKGDECSDNRRDAVTSMYTARDSGYTRRIRNTERHLTIILEDVHVNYNQHVRSGTADGGFLRFHTNGVSTCVANKAERRLVDLPFAIHGSEGWRQHPVLMQSADFIVNSLYQRAGLVGNPVATEKYNSMYRALHVFRAAFETIKNTPAIFNDVLRNMLQRYRACIGTEHASHAGKTILSSCCALSIMGEEFMVGSVVRYEPPPVSRYPVRYQRVNPSLPGSTVHRYSSLSVHTMFSLTEISDRSPPRSSIAYIYNLNIPQCVRKYRISSSSSINLGHNLGQRFSFLNALTWDTGGKDSAMASEDHCEEREGDKGDIVTRIKCAIAAKRKALNWRAVFSSHCISTPGARFRGENVHLKHSATQLKPPCRREPGGTSQTTTQVYVSTFIHSPSTREYVEPKFRLTPLVLERSPGGARTEPAEPRNNRFDTNLQFSYCYELQTTWVSPLFKHYRPVLQSARRSRIALRRANFNTLVSPDIALPGRPRQKVSPPASLAMRRNGEGYWLFAVSVRVGLRIWTAGSNVCLR